MKGTSKISNYMDIGKFRVAYTLFLDYFASVRILFFLL